jgi:lipopolysaccharide transport system permease protein
MSEMLTAEGDRVAKKPAVDSQDSRRTAFISADTVETIIAPRPGWRALNVREMWAYRELLFFLIWRDVKVRYKQTILGAAWAVLQPMVYAMLFVVIFSRVAHAPTEGLPPLLFTFTGFVLWFFFSTAVTQAGNSVIGSEALVTKVYFPRLAIPFAAVGAALFDFAVTLLVLIPMIVYYKWFSPDGSVIVLSWQLALVPGLIVLTILVALGVGAFLAALNVAFRDFKHTIPFLVQLWMLATPAIYLGIEHFSLVKPQTPSTPPATTRVQPSTKAPSRSTASNAAARPTASEGATSPVAKSGNVPATPKPDEGAVPDWVQNFLKFNPMTGLVRAFRAAMLGQPMPWPHLAYSTAIVIAAFLGGCFYYHRVEDQFADII